MRYHELSDKRHAFLPKRFVGGWAMIVQFFQLIVMGDFMYKSRRSPAAREPGSPARVVDTVASLQKASVATLVLTFGRCACIPFETTS